MGEIMNQTRQMPLYIFDLDGTLALVDHREHMIRPPKCKACDGTGYPPDKEELAPCRNCGGKGIDLQFKPDWDAFQNACDQDSPNWPVINLFVCMYQAGVDIRIWSGRGEGVRGKTVDWLYKFTNIHPHQILRMLKMRPEGNFIADHKLKGHWLTTMPMEERTRLSGVFEDRKSVVDFWREHGITCFQVADGNY